MKFLAIERELPGVTAAAFQPLLEDEARRVWELQQSGILREIDFDAERHIAVLVLECKDKDEANQLLATLPLVKADLIAFDLISLVPYDGLSRLFVKSNLPPAADQRGH